MSTHNRKRDFNVCLIIAECKEFSKGYAHGTISATSHPGDNLYLYPDTIVRTNATLVGLDYTASTTGNIIVQVHKYLELLATSKS